MTDAALPLGRRQLLYAAFALAPAHHLFASTKDFWNKKPPSQWSTKEVDQLITDSPWAKQISYRLSPLTRSQDDVASMPTDRGGLGAPPRTTGPGTIGTGIPGIGIGGIGMPRLPGSSRRTPTEPTQRRNCAAKGIVRWESATPILEALREPLPETLSNHYVISVSNIPLPEDRPGNDDTKASTDEDLRMDRLASATSLEPKNGRSIAPEIVLSRPSARGTTVLFGFSRDKLALTPDAKEVFFWTRIRREDIRAHFDLSQMIYQKQLAV